MYSADWDSFPSRNKLTNISTLLIRLNQIEWMKHHASRNRSLIIWYKISNERIHVPELLTFCLISAVLVYIFIFNHLSQKWQIFALIWVWILNHQATYGYKFISLFIYCIHFLDKSSSCCSIFFLQVIFSWLFLLLEI